MSELSEDAAVAASICKSYVSDAARKVCGDAIQVHGGIGFTWEYDLHLYMKRAKALEPLYGDVLAVWRPWARDVRGRGVEASHFLVEDRPDEVARELSAFFESAA